MAAAHAAPQATSPVLQTHSQHFIKNTLHVHCAALLKGSDVLDFHGSTLPERWNNLGHWIPSWYYQRQKIS